MWIFTEHALGKYPPPVLQEKYVLVPADKAGNNIIFVCKYYYIQTLMRELGIEASSTINSTYEAQTITADEVIRTHATTLDELFNITLHQKENNCTGYPSFTRHRIRHVL